MLHSGVMAACIVFYLDTEGVRHTVEVEAESLYEAAVLALRTFRQHECEPGQASKLEVEIRSSITYTVTIRKIHDWVNGGAKTPKEAVMKEKLRALLELDYGDDSSPPTTVENPERWKRQPVKSFPPISFGLLFRSWVTANY